MSNLFKQRINKITVLPFIMGFVMGLIFDSLIIPGLTIPNTYLNVITTILLVVMFIFHYQLARYYYWDKEKRKIIKEIKDSQPDLYEKLIDINITA